MMRRVGLGAIVCGALLVGRGAAAQAVERPVPFDSGGRVTVMTPRLAERLQLGPPTWPVVGAFVEARLYRTGDSTFVLAVQRDAVVERYPLDHAQADQLRRAVTMAAVQEGMPVQAEGTSAAAQPAGVALVVSQTALGLTAYGMLAALATESLVGYAGAAAGAFFVSQAVAAGEPVSAPMATLSADFALRGIVATSLVLGEGPFDDGLGYRTRSGAMLAAGVTGSVAGYLWGRSLTLAEAEAIGWGSTTAGFSALGLASIAGGDAAERRIASAAGMAVGIPLGVWYARNASYALSAGDLYGMRVPQALGAAWGGVIGRVTGASGPGRAAWQTAGLLAGTVLGDRVLTKPYNLTVPQAGVFVMGTAVSALAGVLVVSETNPFSHTARLAVPTAFATVGAVVTSALLDLRDAPRVGRAGAARWLGRVELDPAALVAAATRSPGQHAVLRVAF